MKKQALKIIALCTLLGAFTFSAVAQETTPAKPPTEKQVKAQNQPLTPEQRVEMRVRGMKQKLALTDDQTKKVKALYLEQEKKMEEYMKELRERNKTMNDSLAKILTPEQMKKYKETFQRSGATPPADEKKPAPEKK